MSNRHTLSAERKAAHKDAKGPKKKPTRASIGPIQEINIKHKDLEFGEGEKDGEQTGDTAAKAKAEASDEPWLEKYVNALLFWLHGVWEKLMSRVRRDRMPKNVVPILITPVKRLEREVRHKTLDRNSVWSAMFAMCVFMLITFLVTVTCRAHKV